MDTAKTGAPSLLLRAGRGGRGEASLRLRRWRRAQRGVAAVELAIVLPLLLLVLFGIVEMGVLFYDKAVITNASREGARAGVVLKSPKPTTSDVQTVVTNYTSSYLMTFGTQNTPAVVTSGAGGTFGQPLSVTVTYRYQGMALGRLIAPITGPITLSATTVMNNE
ncbi:TadE/TadG family type IV pilus assembly protein [Paraburkholderia adhaesiva]|uniref:TadE/TadG family type IV pilus assembly protein n=1 Tax=Paraburkholderia adhaesiva TaxID=2883244 RepID=UPI001F228D1D|nr:TadE/TadG family type IV pilus assembly protein [Paraburkholderia adhaesiva]